MNAIRWIFFDIGSTLVDEEEAYNHRIRDMIQGTSVTFEQFWDKRIQFAKEGITEIKRQSSILASTRRLGTAKRKFPLMIARKSFGLCATGAISLVSLQIRSPAQKTVLTRGDLADIFR